MEKAKATLKVISYFGIFDYPPTLKQVMNYFPVKISRKELLEELRKNKKIKKSGDFYFLKNKPQALDLRRNRLKFSIKKFRAAKKAASIIAKIPTVYFIGISGSLSMQNCEKDDDIDFFVIAKKRTMWSTRLCMLTILQLLGARRKRDGKEHNNKICLNMILDEEFVEFAKKRQNIYSAHEIFQMIPVFERKNMYNRFIVANRWSFKFLPNAKPQKILFKAPFLPFGFIFYFLEPLAKFAQIKYMGKILNEEVSDVLLAFHPLDYSKKVLSLYNRQLRTLL